MNMSIKSKLVKVNDSFSVYRYDNGWMVEVGGRDENDDWKTTKLICHTEEALTALVREYNSIPVQD